MVPEVIENLEISRNFLIMLNFKILIYKTTLQHFLRGFFLHVEKLNGTKLSIKLHGIFFF